MIWKLLHLFGIHWWHYYTTSNQPFKEYLRVCLLCSKKQALDEGAKIGLEDIWEDIK